MSPRASTSSPSNACRAMYDGVPNTVPVMVLEHVSTRIFLHQPGDAEVRQVDLSVFADRTLPGLMSR